jgi:UPF0755 protein
MKRRSGGRATIISVLVVSIIIFALVLFAWNTVLDIFEPVTNNKTNDVSITVQNGETAAQIGDDLQRRGIIHNAYAFRIWAHIKGLDASLEAGKYDHINPRMTISEIIDEFQKGQPDEIIVRVKEGTRLEEIANAATSANLPKFSKADFLKYTSNINNFPDRNNYPLLFNGVPAGSSMEGLLFPDTYYMPTNGTALDLIDKMLTEMTTQIKTQKVDQLAEQNKLSLYNLITVASIVQREANNTGDMSKIARVYLNRIYTDNGIAETGGGHLQADPTVQYARDSEQHPTQYWLPLADSGNNIATNSLWNTYVNTGLPPTPICSPSLDSLLGTVKAQASNNLYFFTDPKGVTHFQDTLDQFNQQEGQYGVSQ